MVNGRHCGNDHSKLPFKIAKSLSGNEYTLQDLDGTRFQRNINGKFLKFYYPTTWEIYANNIQSKYPEFWENMRALH